MIKLKENIEDLNRENEALKDANQKLLTSAFSMEREREFREKERALKIQIAQLEATLKSDVGEKGNILDRLTAERGFPLCDSFFISILLICCDLKSNMTS